MTKKTTSYIIIFFTTTFLNGVFAQNLSLKITSKDSLESQFLKKIVFNKKHLTENAIYNETSLISQNLKQAGYFLNSIDSIIKKDTTYTSYFFLGEKVDFAFIKISTNETPFIKHSIKDNVAKVNIESLPNFLSSISNKLEQSGKSFSEVRLKNIQFKKKSLFAELDINQSKKRTIDKVIIKGYDRFSKSHLKHFLNVKKGSIFNQQKVNNISSNINSLDFVSEIKPPEILFSKDSTLLYIYLKEQKTNSFDGLLNFASKENGDGLLFNGHLDLKLNNILHTGEQFELLWRANGEERQEFKIATLMPYIFNSAFTPDLSFSIYKQDSSFLSTKFHSGITYNIKPKMTISLTYDSETSENTLQNNINTTIRDFDNSFIGSLFTYQESNNDTFFNDKFLIQLNPSFGSRNSNGNKTNQFKLNIEASYLWEPDNRNTVFIRNETGYLNSDSFIENELYRIGGANSIRGFNEQSIFTTQYSFINLEYRYLTSQNSYLYSITDFGRIKTLNSVNKNLYGLGLGYLFKIKNSQVNIGYVIGKSPNQTFDLKQSKLLITLLSYF